MNKDIVILGGRGMLGSDVAQVLTAKGVSFKLFDLPEFDICDARQVAAVVNGSGAVINCAAYTNVENAEAEPDIAMRVNGEAVGNLGDLCRRSGVWLLHIGTDFVFDGKLDRPYKETDPTKQALR
jgi:dTDP-4-dehydrorhamnose reductase